MIWKLGLCNYGAVLFLLFSILGLGIYLQNQILAFDEDEQTAQDYSITVTNPPPKATDPEEWRKYFEESFPGVKVAAITCAVNNDLLVRALVARREVLRMMELKLEPGTAMDIDNLALLAAKIARSRYRFLSKMIAWVDPGPPELLSKLVALNTKIKGLAQLSYPCTNVFVTFENEKDQRRVLHTLTKGAIHVIRNNKNCFDDPKFLFQGNHVLAVSESVEPNSVRWQDLNIPWLDRFDQMLITNSITFVAIIVVAIIVAYANAAFPGFGSAFSIAGKCEF